VVAQTILPIGGPDKPVAVEAPVAVEDLYYEYFRAQDDRTLAVIVDRKTGARTLLVVDYSGLALAPLPKVASEH
jgi:hypothetical protein